MKTYLQFIPTTIALAASIQVGLGQSVAGAQTRNQSEWAVSERGPHSSVWERTEYESGPNGEQRPIVHSYTELATGLCYEKDGQYVDSKAEIDVLPNGAGAAASQGQHKVIFPPDLYNGQIELNTPDGKWLRSRVLGLSYFDTASGDSVMIGQITNSVGELHGQNVVIYPDAFTDVHADVRYTYTLAGFEQDIVVRSRLPSPADYGLDPETTRLEVLTEFFDPPTPVKTVREVRGTPDQRLDFGVMKIGQGKAFALGDESEQKRGVPVTKSWEKLEGRDFLIEEVEFKAVEAQLDRLPRSAMNSIPTAPGSGQRRATKSRALPAPRMARKQNTEKFLVAKADIEPRPGYVLDYTTVSSQSNYHFEGDKTYYVSGSVYLSGTTTIEGGAVIKYNNTGSAKISLSGPVNCLTAAYRPAVFTSKYDSTVGEAVASGTPATYGGSALYFYLSLDVALSNLRISYANIGFDVGSGEGHSATLRNVQFVNCVTAVREGGYYDYPQVNIYNGLIHNVTTGFDVWYGGDLTAQHVTVSDCGTLVVGESLQQYSSCAFLNSVFADVGSLSSGSGVQLSGQNNGFYQSSQFGSSSISSPSNPFQTAGAGAHYLANSSSFRNQGTPTGLDAQLLTELEQRTTYPPVIYSGATISSVTTLSPQAQRDTDTPDLGYHYDPLDYVFGDSDVNADLTFSAGTAVGWYRTTSNHGIHMADQKILNFDGTQESPCHWARWSTVQEGGNGVWSGGWGPMGIIGTANQNLHDVGLSPEVKMRFTRCSILASDAQYMRDYNGYLILRANNSEFSSGSLGGYILSCYLTNCLMDRTYGGQVAGWDGNEYILKNCTWIGNHIDLTPYHSAMPIIIQNCAFDGTTFTFSGYALNAGNASYDHNAYPNATDPFPLGGTGDKSSVAFNWQDGPLGKCYLPSDSVLINAGSTTADAAGLYHFTTQTSETREAATQVDIGYHYVAGGPDTTDLVGYWPLDEGTGTTAGDSSGYGHNGTLYNGPAWTSGQLGSGALNFDGVNDYVSVANTTALQVGGSGANFSVSFWLRLEAGYTGSWRNLMHKGSSNSQRTFAIWQYPSNNKLYFRISTTAGDEGGLSVSAMPLNQWVHVAYVKVGNKLRLYLNGGLDAEVTLSGVSVSNTGPIYFGKDPWYNGTDCSLDDVRIYSRALAGSEISLLADTRFSPRDTDGDNLADYVEDANGNGSVDSGETSPTDRDTDHDGLSDYGEITIYGTDPANAHTFNMYKNDAEYLFIARPLDNTTMASLAIVNLGGGLLEITVDAPPYATYDLYYVNNLLAQRWQWRRVLSEIQCDSAGEAMVVIQQPDPSQGFFVILSADDEDGDGLTDGYEAWFNYNGQHTLVDNALTDSDLLPDGWEVEYGINPTVATDPDGDTGNPDGDAVPGSNPPQPLDNQSEFDFYSPFGGLYDPLKAYNTSADRPVVSIFADDENPACDQASFSIYRYGGSYGEMWVYYSVGGTLSYDDGDYDLNPTPTEWPRIYSAKFDAGQQYLPISVDAEGVSPNEGDVETVVVSLTPYVVSPDPQVADPSAWNYVVDWTYNRAKITFDFDNLAPQAVGQSLPTCRNTDLPITLSGNDGCNDELTYTLVGSGPQYGTLIDDVPPDLIYRPDTDYEGSDSFNFKVNDGYRDSAEATISIEVGVPPVADNQTRVTHLSCPINIVLTGSDGCDGQHPLTFSIESQPTLGTLCGTPPNLTYDPNFTGNDYFVFKVSDGVHDAFGTVSIQVLPDESDAFWTDSGLTDEQLAELLSAPGDTVANVTHTGDLLARGVFGGGISAGLPYDTGVILSSGDIHLAAGPNNVGGAGVEYGNPGDQQLDALLDPLETETQTPLDTEDAVVLEFDLTPSSSVLQFDYIFASEEYPEWLQQLKNDAVAIFVDDQNIAWVPNTTDPVCVFTVNSGRNSDYYQDNPETPNEVFDLQYDGFTSNQAHPWLTASATVQVGVPVHVKIVIADEDDAVWDSAVFIRAKRSLQCALPCE